MGSRVSTAPTGLKSLHACMQCRACMRALPAPTTALNGTARMHTAACACMRAQQQQLTRPCMLAKQMASCTTSSIAASLSSSSYAADATDPAIGVLGATADVRAVRKPCRRARSSRANESEVPRAQWASPGRPEAMGRRARIWDMCRVHADTGTRVHADTGTSHKCGPLLGKKREETL
jgi:hypothetical protein